MAATVSPWAKPGAWALAAEEQEAELEQQAKEEQQRAVEPASADFPSLSAAAATKPKKKKQTTSLAVEHPVGLTHEDRMLLPTGPRERTAEELQRNGLGGGFKTYGGDRGNSRYSNGDESSDSKWGQRKEGGFGKESNRDEPSRADEVDDWGAAKKSMSGNSFERRERGGGGSFLGGSQSKADESDSWVSNKSSMPSEGRRVGGGGGGFDRERKVGFPSNGGADSDNWGRKKEETNGGSGFDRERKVGYVSSGGGADSDVWGKKRGESNFGLNESTARPRLNLQPRTLPVSNETSPGSATAPKPKGSNPFGAARPREEVLAEKGKDWKEIDEQLESAKIKEVAGLANSESFGRRSFGMGNERAGDRTERAWRKPDSRPQSADKSETKSNSEEPEGDHVEPENEHVDEN
ncbi:eukaryotic translation initiation factor 4B3-like [Pyrus communis]|uniref:eukaryotic translation initiation factor 4B3-like n=1 Tax=Pyrus communis TaxID=23211 RepID=UPI0035BF2607